MTTVLIVMMLTILLITLIVAARSINEMLWLNGSKARSYYKTRTIKPFIQEYNN